MNHLAQAIADTYEYYAVHSGDLEGFFSDLAVIIQDCEDDLEALPETLESNLILARAMDGEDEED